MKKNILNTFNVLLILLILIFLINKHYILALCFIPLFLTNFINNEPGDNK